MFLLKTKNLCIVSKPVSRSPVFVLYNYNNNHVLPTFSDLEFESEVVTPESGIKDVCNMTRILQKLFCDGKNCL